MGNHGAPEKNLGLMPIVLMMLLFGGLGRFSPKVLQLPRSSTLYSSRQASMIVLGISAYYHDSAGAAIVRDGVLVNAAQEERFTRKKARSRFSAEIPLAWCLKDAGLTPRDIILRCVLRQAHL